MLKVVEQADTTQLKQYLLELYLLELYQSAYRAFHSTETAILKVNTDILHAIDCKLCVLLSLLDLSASFDTIDYAVLFKRLAEYFGISGKVLDWIKSYLSGCRQSVVIEESRSDTEHLEYGVPQGSVPGPLLFTLYMAPLCDLLRKHGVRYHCYADDTQIYLSFKPEDVQSACSRIENCIADFREWMNKTSCA